MDLDEEKSRIWFLDKGNELQDIKIDDVPIWWFFKPTLIVNTLPKPFLNFDEISNDRNIGFFRRFKTRLFSYSLRRYILMNEKKKIKLRKKNLINDEKSKVLFLTYSNHVNSDKIFRLSPLLDKMTDKDTYILVSDLISNHASGNITSYGHMIYDYIDEAILKEANKLASEFYFKLNKLRKTSLYGGINEELGFLFSKNFLEVIFIYYLGCKELIKRENIKGIVVTADTGFFDRILLACAGYYDVPVVMVHHGNPGTVPMETLSKTKICLKGKNSLENLKKLNFNGEMVVTGSVESDKILEYKKKVNNTKKKVMILTAPLVEDNFMSKDMYKSYVKRYVSEISNLDVDVVISLHPREKDLGLYKEISRDYSNVSVLHSLDLDQFYESLNSVDLLFYFGASFSAVEAIFFDKPVVSVNLYGDSLPYLDYFKGSNVVVKLDKEEDVSEMISKMLYDGDFKEELAKRREDYIAKYYYTLDGKATERIVDEICKSFSL
tara:strand:- start:44 stop:1525 length:1482 start_codon:yes stop_codon:yes gene_type:complete